jgi:gamma-butyrobetaine dioxygenase
MQISTISHDFECVTIGWEDGRSSRFHHIWLRDNCPTARHPVVGERALDPVSIPLDIQPQSVNLNGSGKLHITWPNDGHQSEYDAGWLHNNAYEFEAREARRFRPTYWTTEMINGFLPEVQYEDVMHEDEGLLYWLRLLNQYGFTIVRGVPTEPGMVMKVAERVSFLRNSNFGILFDVESKPNPNSLAYTAVKLNAHTDLVSREVQPGLQFLHCLVFDAEGGASILVDGFAAAEELKQSHPNDYEFLTTVPIPFRYQDKETDLGVKGPIIRLDADGNYYDIRYSTALLAPLDLDHHLVKPFYRAFGNYSKILRDPRYEFKFRLQPGDLESFNNRRVLHGRDEFNPQSGPRHLQGCYVDTDDFLSRLRVLERSGRDFRESMSLVR